MDSNHPNPSGADTQQPARQVRENTTATTAVLIAVNGVIVVLSALMAFDKIQEGTQSVAGLLYLITFPLLIVAVALLLKTERHAERLPTTTRRTRLVLGAVGAVAFFVPLLV